MFSKTLPVAIIGAGPVGLAAAAHLLERGETPIIFESGSAVGANIRNWAHVRMFSPWGYTVDKASVRLLEKHGWQMPPSDELPTGGDLVTKYMVPFSQLPEVKEHLHLDAKVIAISRLDVDKMKDAGRDDAAFILHVVYGNGQEALIEARAVIDASGTWHKPNPLGSGGLPAIGEQTHADYISYGIPDILDTDSAHFANQRVMVVGNGHSAINALLELIQLQESYPETEIYWAMRTTNLKAVYGGGEDDALPARGALGTRIKAQVDAGNIEIVAPFRIREIQSASKGINVIGVSDDKSITVNVDSIIGATGSRPDLDMLRELRLEVDPALESAKELAPMIDPNIHSCGTVRPHGEAELRHPEKNFYIVGMKSYGRAPTFLLATGYEQVRSVVAALVGDWKAARDVQLDLPETGVCSTDFIGEGAACCGSTSSVQQAAPLLSVVNIGVKDAQQQQPVVLTPATKDCGCDDTCCSDGTRSTTCGCGDSCCS